MKILYDVILILLILTVAFGIIVAIDFFGEKGSYVLVSVNSEELYRLPLSEDTVKVFSDGENTNTIVIENGTAYISEANCPDGRCTRHLPIDLVGKCIICKPHKLTVEIVK